MYAEPFHSGDTWQGFSAMRQEFDHWLWKELEDDAEGGGHGGMDYVLQWRTIQQMRAGLVPDIDVYDSAVWCSPIPLSVESLAKKGKPVADPRLSPAAPGASPGSGSTRPASEMPAVP